MGDVKKIADEALDAISGGKIVGQTSYGFNYDEKGTVDFNGMKISAADWKYLLSRYAGPTTRDKEAALATVPVSDVKKILNDHNSPFNK